MQQEFRVTVTAEDGTWVAVVEGLPGCVCRTRRLSTLDDQVRARLAELLGRPAASFVLDYTVRDEPSSTTSL